MSRVLLVIDSHMRRLTKKIPNSQKFIILKFSLTTECARDPDLYNLVSCGKFVNDILFSTFYKTHYLTLGHPAISVTLS